jgi:hypothetical protein
MNDLDDKIKQQIINRLDRLNVSPNNDDVTTHVFCGRAVRPILQIGPTCGLVSLMMAEQVMQRSECFVDQTDDRLQRLLDLAIENNLTKQGEMFFGTFGFYPNFVRFIKH